MTKPGPFRLNQHELFNVVLDSFSEETRGKNEEQMQIIKKTISSLSREIMTALDVRQLGALDVR